MRIEINESIGLYNAVVSNFDPESQSDLDELAAFMADAPSLYYVEVTSSGVTFQDNLHTVHPASKITVQPRFDDDEQFGREDIIKILARSPGFGNPMDYQWIEHKLERSAIKLDAGAVFSQATDSVSLEGTTFAAIVNGERI